MRLWACQLGQRSDVGERCFCLCTKGVIIFRPFLAIIPGYYLYIIFFPPKLVYVVFKVTVEYDNKTENSSQTIKFVI